MKQSFGALQLNMTYLKAINKYFATFLKVFLERLMETEFCNQIQMENTK